jgi:hypothetical protein
MKVTNFETSHRLKEMANSCDRLANIMKSLASMMGEDKGQLDNENPELLTKTEE